MAAGGMHHILRTHRRKGPRVSLGGVDRRSRACDMDRGRVWFFQLPTRLFVVCFRCCSFFSSKKIKARHHKSASSVEIDVEIARRSAAAACVACSADGRVLGRGCLLRCAQERGSDRGVRTPASSQQQQGPPGLSLGECFNCLIGGTSGG